MGRYRMRNESAERRKILNTLVQICIYLHDDYEENYLSGEVLHDMPIDVSSLSLEDGEIDAGLLSFFKPLGKTNLENLWPEMTIPEEWPEWSSRCDDVFCDDCSCDCNSVLCSDNFTAADWVEDISSCLCDLPAVDNLEWCGRDE